MLTYTWIDVLRFIINDAHKVKGFRESFRFDKIDGQTIEKTTRDLVDQLLASVEYASIPKKFQNRFIKKGLTSDCNRLNDIINLELINADTIFSVRKDIHYTISETDREIILTYYNKQIKFPNYVLPTLQAVIDSEKFTVQSLESNMDTPGKLVFCKKLLKEGFIKISNNGS